MPVKFVKMFAHVLRVISVKLLGMLSYAGMQMPQMLQLQFLKTLIFPRVL